MFETTLALIVFLLPLAYSPGPGNLFFAALGARFGVRATIPASAGYHLATWVVTVAIGLGFAAAVEAAPGMATAIRWAGATYVLRLAFGFLQAGTHEAEATARPAGFIDGAVLFLLNPKAYLIIALMFSQFLVEAAPDRLGAVLWIATVFTLNNLVAFVAWTVLGDRLAAGFRRPGAAQRLNRLFAGALAGVAIWMLAA